MTKAGLPNPGVPLTRRMQSMYLEAGSGDLERKMRWARPLMRLMSPFAALRDQRCPTFPQVGFPGHGPMFGSRSEDRSNMKKLTTMKKSKSASHEGNGGIAPSQPIDASIRQRSGWRGEKRNACWVPSNQLTGRPRSGQRAEVEQASCHASEDWTARQRLNYYPREDRSV